MNKSNIEYSRLNTVLKNAKHNFLCLETNGTFFEQRLVELLQKKKHTLSINCKNKDELRYDNIIEKVKISNYEMLVFYGCCNEEMDSWLLSAINLNRDNLKNLNVVIVLILPTYLCNVLVSQYPNLNSYISFRFDFTVKFFCPFRPMMMLDDFTVNSKSVVASNKALAAYSDDTEFDGMLTKMEAFSYDKKEVVNLFIKKLLPMLVERERINLKTVGEVQANERFYRDYLRVCVALIKQRVYEDALIVLQTILMNIYLIETDSKEDINKKLAEIDYTKTEELYIFYKDNLQKLDKSNISFFDACKALHYFAHLLFYRKKYEDALEWLRILLECPKVQTFSSFYLQCLSDYCICLYKLNNYEKMLPMFERIANMIKKADGLDYRIVFICNYNYIVIKLLNEESGFDILGICNELLGEYGKKYEKKSPLYTKYLSVYSWTLGYLLGNTHLALAKIKEALTIERQVVIENHYSIGESHYCHSIFYIMEGNFNQAKYCLKKAINIFKNRSKENSVILGMCNQLKEFIDSVDL